MSPELLAALIAAGGVALIFAGGREERATLPKPTTDQEGADDAEAIPAENL